MKRILATRCLQQNQRDLLLQANIRLVEYNFITQDPIPFILPQDITHAIFTSQNAVNGFFSKWKNNVLPTFKVFCVGNKTAALLRQNGLQVCVTKPHAKALAKTLCKDYKQHTFHFFCGTARRPELPETLAACGVTLKEVALYKTIAQPKRFSQIFDGILFFSPSAVASFVQKNNITNAPAFCIGNTTAQFAKQLGATVYVANSPTIESVIAKTVKILNAA